VLTALVDMILPLTLPADTPVDRARDLKEAAQIHLRIYQAIRAKDPDGASGVLKEYLSVRGRRSRADSPAPAPTESRGVAPAAKSASRRR
jgi:DNA-binding FadR family transcriptional regulator